MQGDGDVSDFRHVSQNIAEETWSWIMKTGSNLFPIISTF